jgi:hypothetical protein
VSAEKADVHEGDTVFVHDGSTVVEAKVLKVARKLITLDYYHETKFRLDDGHINRTRYGSGCWFNTAEEEKQIQLDSVDDKLFRSVRVSFFSSSLKKEDKRAIADLLRARGYETPPDVK